MSATELLLMIASETLGRDDGKIFKKMLFKAHLLKKRLKMQYSALVLIKILFQIVIMLISFKTIGRLRVMIFVTLCYPFLIMVECLRNGIVLFSVVSNR